MRWSTLSSDFRQIINQSHKIVTKSAILFLSNRQNPPHLMVGFVASKKVGNAVKRNLCKRRMRAVCGDFLQQRSILPYKGSNLKPNTASHHLVIIARRHLIDADFAQVKRDITRCLNAFLR